MPRYETFCLMLPLANGSINQESRAARGSWGQDPYPFEKTEPKHLFSALYSYRVIPKHGKVELSTVLQRLNPQPLFLTISSTSASAKQCSKAVLSLEIFAVLLFGLDPNPKMFLVAHLQEIRMKTNIVIDPPEVDDTDRYAA